MPLLSVNSWFGTKSPFFTQTMRHCVPNPGVILVMSLLFTGSIIFLIISAVAFSFNASQAYGIAQYNTASSTPPSQPESVTVTLHRLQIDRPLYLYYHLEDFHQNVRFYVSSFSRKQLQSSNFLTAGFNKDCVKSGPSASEPCGLIYQSRFNDTLVDVQKNTATFTITSKNTPPNQPNSKTVDLSLDTTGVAWKEDIDSTKMYGDAFRKLNNYESVAVWMRVSPRDKFDKLYGQFTTDELKKLGSDPNSLDTIYNDSREGSVKVTFSVTNNFPYGKKSIVLQQMTVFGGYYETRNLAILSIILGCIMFICALTFLIIFLERGPRSAKYKTVLEQFPIVTNSSILLSELERMGDEKVRKTIHQVKTEMGLK